MGLGEIRAQLDSRIKLSNGRINLALMEKYPAEGVVCLGALWRQPNQFRKTLMGAIEIALLDRCHALRVERFGVLLLGRCCRRWSLSMEGYTQYQESRHQSEPDEGAITAIPEHGEDFLIL